MCIRCIHFNIMNALSQGLALVSGAEDPAQEAPGTEISLFKALGGVPRAEISVLPASLATRTMMRRASSHRTYRSNSGPSLAKPDLDLATREGRFMEVRARSALDLGGMPGGLGIAVAIEPAGGVSPLRGGAEVC